MVIRVSDKNRIITMSPNCQLSLLYSSFNIFVLDCIIQAYNYGSGFLDYAAKFNGVYSTELAEKFAEKQSGGNTIQYDNPMAVQENGGWRYAYGNMFYARLVKQYLIE